MSARKIVIVGFALSAVIAGLTVCFRWGETTGDAKAPAAVIVPRSESDVRGPRPTTTRLRNGARQIEDAEQAIASAERTLAGIERELRSTGDADRRKLLAHQKRLTETAIARLKK